MPITSLSVYCGVKLNPADVKSVFIMFICPNENEASKRNNSKVIFFIVIKD